MGSFKRLSRQRYHMDAHGLVIPPLLQTSLEITLLATAMILLLAPRDGRVHEAITLILLAVVGRVLMAPIPNVQPVTVLVMLASLRLGTARGVSLGILVAYLSNLFLGGGPWTIVQAISWGSVGLATGMFADAIRKDDYELCIRSFCLFSIPMAFLFGFVVSLPLGIMAWVNGIPFDVLHAIGNLTIAVWLLQPFDTTLEWVRPDVNRGLTAPSRQV